MPDGQCIVITPVGRMANQMFQLMLATELRRRSGLDIPILGYDLPEWGLTAPAGEVPAGVQTLTLSWNRFNLDWAAAALRLELADVVNIRGWGMRLEYYQGPAQFAAMFRAPAVDFHPTGENEIVLNVRGGDIISGWHKEYFPMPVAYYRRIIEQTGLRPVFVGETHDDGYGDLLRKSFPDARFPPHRSVISDFETVRNARHVALSVSSFSWLAAWLSDSAATIHMPLCGLFDPLGAEMLVPANDARYRFYRVPFPEREARRGLDLRTWLLAPHAVDLLDRTIVTALVTRGIFANPAPPPPKPAPQGRPGAAEALA